MRIQRPPLKLLFPILAISLIATVSYAVSVTVTNNNFQADNGLYFNVAGGFTAASNGFQVTQTSASANVTCTWTAGDACVTALTAGHWQYSVTLTINAGAAANTLYTMTVQWNTGSGYVSMGTRTVTTGATITAGQTMTFLFDTGGTTINAPAGIVVTVA